MILVFGWTWHQKAMTCIHSPAPDFSLSSGRQLLIGLIPDKIWETLHLVSYVFPVRTTRPKGKSPETGSVM